MEIKMETKILILEDYKKSGVISAADAEKIKNETIKDLIL